MSTAEIPEGEAAFFSIAGIDRHGTAVVGTLSIDTDVPGWIEGKFNARWQDLRVWRGPRYEPEGEDWSIGGIWFNEGRRTWSCEA